MTDTMVDRPAVTDISDDDDDKLTHIVAPASAVTEALILGTPVTALCGFVFVPHRNPERFPKCRRCCDVLDDLQRLRGRI